MDVQSIVLHRMLLSTSTLCSHLVLLPGMHAHLIGTAILIGWQLTEKEECKILITFLHKYPSSVVRNTNAYETIIFINSSCSN